MRKCGFLNAQGWIVNIKLLTESALIMIIIKLESGLSREDHRANKWWTDEKCSKAGEQQNERERVQGVCPIAEVAFTSADGLRLAMHLMTWGFLARAWLGVVWLGEVFAVKFLLSGLMVANAHAKCADAFTELLVRSLAHLPLVALVFSVPSCMPRIRQFADINSGRLFLLSIRRLDASDCFVLCTDH